MLLVLISIVITAVASALLTPILETFGASSTVLPYARDYLRIIVLGTIFQTLGFGLNATIRGEGNPRVAMLSMVISVLVNLILAPLFVFGFSWGMKGAASATVIAKAVAAVWVLAYFLGGTSLLRLHARNLRLNRAICTAIFVIGAPSCAMQIANSILQSILLGQLRTHGGDMAIAVFGIIYSALMVIAMPIVGINQGAQPIIGYNHGARRFDRVKKALETAILAASTLVVFGFVVMMIFPAEVVRLFVSRSDPALGPNRPGYPRHSHHDDHTADRRLSNRRRGLFPGGGQAERGHAFDALAQVLCLIPAVLILPHFLRSTAFGPPSQLPTRYRPF